MADLTSGDVLLMHLGMSGSFRVGKDSALSKYYYERSKSTAHDHVIFHMSNGATVTFNDPRRFGSMKLVSRAKIENEPLLRALGPEPLGNEFDAAMLDVNLHGKKSYPIADALPARGVRRSEGEGRRSEGCRYCRMGCIQARIQASDQTGHAASGTRGLGRAAGLRLRDLAQRARGLAGHRVPQGQCVATASGCRASSAWC